MGQNNLSAITSLAAIGIASHNVELTQAAFAEILAMPTDRRRGLDPTREVDRLLFLDHLKRVSRPQDEYRYVFANSLAGSRFAGRSRPEECTR